MDIGTSSSSRRGARAPCELPTQSILTRLSWGGLTAPGRGLRSVRPDACHLTVAKEKMGRCSLGTADGDGGGRVTGGAVGRWLRLDRGLGVAGLVGGAGFEQVVARCRGPLP